MELFWKAAAIIILTVILGVTIGKAEKDISVVLTVAACCIVMIVVVQYLSGVIDFLWILDRNSGYPMPFLEILLKIAGVALTTEIIGFISSDAGNYSLSKAMEILGNTAILFLSLPLFEGFFAMIQDIMGFL